MAERMRDMKSRNGRRPLAGMLMMALSMAPAGFAVPADAATIAVTTNADAGAGSLRAAITAANGAAGADDIDLAAVAGQTIPLASALPSITGTLTIAGVEGDPTIIDGGDAVRPFFVNANVAFRDITIRNGLAVGGDGGGSHLGGGGGGAAGMGGAVFIQSGTVVFQRVTFSGNVARGGNGGEFIGAGPFGGGGGGGVAGADADGGFPAGGAGGPGGPLAAAGQGGAGGANASTGAAGGALGGGGGGGGFGRGGGAGGFGGGGGGGGGTGGAVGGNFAGTGSSGAGTGGGGGGGAGLGGAVFVRAGSTTFEDCTFTGNTATRGIGRDIFGFRGTDGQGKGGAVFVHVPGGASVIDLGGHTFSGNAADDDAGVEGDDDNVFGVTNLPVTLSDIELD